MHTVVVVHLITDSETAVTIHTHTHTSNLYTHRVVNTLAVVDTYTDTHTCLWQQYIEIRRLTGAAGAKAGNHGGCQHHFPVTPPGSHTHKYTPHT